MKSEVTEHLIVARSLPWQQDLITALVKLRNEQQLPHAILIELDTQVDNEAFGWHLIKSLLCLSPVEALSCNECSNCQLVRANNFPDFTYVTVVENDKTHKLNKDIKIDQIRRLIHRFSLTSTQTLGKYALIYPAEKMNQSAANSLLKTLEEPADNSTLILLTHHANRLPITIRSRCQRWQIKNPDHQQAMAWLQTEGITASVSEEYLSLSGNDPQLALALNQQDFSHHFNEFSQLLDQFLQNQVDVVQLQNSLKNLDNVLIQLLIKNTFKHLIMSQTGLPLTQNTKHTLKGLLQLQTFAMHILNTADNNLNLQLQFEDVLLSLKHLMNDHHSGGNNYARA